VISAWVARSRCRSMIVQSCRPHTTNAVALSTAGPVPWQRPHRSSPSRRHFPAESASPRRITLAALALIVPLLAGCESGGPGMMGNQVIPAKFESNGERIYYTGVGSSGNPVTYTGGNMHLRMMGGGCATCHGASRAGARMMPQFWLVAPPLTRDALFEHHDDGSGHGKHVDYDAATLRRAIARGLDPSGKLLDSNMPRWSMSERDWQDLLAYLEK
jgi:cytochrome c oxidase subunit 2